MRPIADRQAAGELEAFFEQIERDRADQRPRAEREHGADELVGPLACEPEEPADHEGCGGDGAPQQRGEHSAEMYSFTRLGR